MKILTALLGMSLLFPIACVACDNPKPDVEDQDLIGSLIKHGKDGYPGKNGQNGENGGSGGKGGDSDCGNGGNGGNGGDAD